jgi:hypothetical protein
MEERGMMNLLAIGALEKVALIGIYGISAVGAVLIVIDVIKEFGKMIKNHQMGIHNYDDDEE